MKHSRRQMKHILHVRKLILTNVKHWLEGKQMKQEDWISFYYYYKCYRWEYGGEGISKACFDNWMNKVSIRISQNNPYKKRYEEFFSKSM